MIRARQMKQFLRERVFIARSIPGSGTPTFGEVWPQIKTVEGWLVLGQEKWLFKTTQTLPYNANIVEIGAFKGRSSVSIGLACLKTSRRVFSIDTFQGNETDFVNGKGEVSWSGTNFLPEFWANITRLGVQDYVVPLAGFSHEVAKFWRAPIHFLFIDGSHQYEDVLNDFNSFFPYVVSGGVVAFHDVTPEWADVYKVWTETVSPKLRNISSETTLAFGYKP